MKGNKQKPNVIISIVNYRKFGSVCGFFACATVPLLGTEKHSKKKEIQEPSKGQKKDANPKSPNGPKSLRAADGKMRNAILSLEAVRHRQAHSGGVGHAGRWLRRPGRSGQRKAHTARDRQPLPVSCNIFRH